MLSIANASLCDANSLLLQSGFFHAYLYETIDSFYEVNDLIYVRNDSLIDANENALSNPLSSSLLSWRASTSLTVLLCTHDVIDVIKGVFYVIKESPMRSMKKWGDAMRTCNLSTTMRVDSG